jgi:hypothetical protein
MKTVSFSCLILLSFVAQLSCAAPQQGSGSKEVEDAFRKTLNKNAAAKVFEQYCQHQKQLGSPARGQLESALGAMSISSALNPNSLFGLMKAVLSDQAVESKDVSEEENECGVCALRKNQVYFEPCEHGLCFSCELRLKMNEMKCPFCRGPTDISKIIKGSHIKVGHGQSAKQFFVGPASGFESTLKEYQGSLETFERLIHEIQQNGQLRGVFSDASSGDLNTADIMRGFGGDTEQFQNFVSQEVPEGFLQELVGLMTQNNVKWLAQELFSGENGVDYFLRSALTFLGQRDFSFRNFLSHIQEYITVEEPFEQREWWNEWGMEAGAFGQVVEDLESAADTEHLVNVFSGVLSERQLLAPFVQMMVEQRANSVQRILALAPDNRIDHILDTLELPEQHQQAVQETHAPFQQDIQSICTLLARFSATDMATVSKPSTEFNDDWNKLTEAHIGLMKAFEVFATKSTNDRFKLAGKASTLDELAATLGVGPKLISDLKWYSSQFFALFTVESSKTNFGCSM